MPVNVIKRDGSKEPFDIEKVQTVVRKAAEEVGIADDRIEEILMETSEAATATTQNTNEVATSTIRDEVLATLDALEPSVSEAWRKYDAEYKTE